MSHQFVLPGLLSAARSEGPTFTPRLRKLLMFIHHVFFHSSHKEGREDTDHAQRDEHPAKRSGKKNRGIAVAQHERATQTVFAYGAQNETEHNGRGV